MQHLIMNDSFSHTEVMGVERHISHIVMLRVYLNYAAVSKTPTILYIKYS